MAFNIKQNDTRPPLQASLKQADNTPIDLTNATAVKLVLRKVGQPTAALKEDCVFIDREEGQIEYDWEPTDTAENGTFDGEFEITWTGGDLQTVPNVGYFQVIVVDDLG